MVLAEGLSILFASQRTSFIDLFCFDSLHLCSDLYWFLPSTKGFFFFLGVLDIKLDCVYEFFFS